MTDYAYQVTDPLCNLVLQATESCRYPKRIEIQLLDAGYSIRLHGRKLTKKEVRG